MRYDPKPQSALVKLGPNAFVFLTKRSYFTDYVTRVHNVRNDIIFNKKPPFISCRLSIWCPIGSNFGLYSHRRGNGMLWLLVAHGS
jgi:hypothetical protein